MPRSSRAQTELTFTTHGGKRRGAGRKPRGDRAGVSHATRPKVSPRTPVLVTMKALPELRSLRTQRALRAMLPSLAAARDSVVRVVHFSVQRDHLHRLVEAADARALGRGIGALASRLARATNRAFARRGALWRDRYHARVLGSPRQVRNALAYVLGNARKHGARLPSRALDPFSSAAAFDGWDGPVVVSAHPLTTRLLALAAPARSWLLRVGWCRAGPPLDPDHRPGPLRD